MKRVLLLLLLALAAASGRAADSDTPDGKKTTKDPTKDVGSGEGLVNSLLAPGPLMEGHKDLEHSSCLKCHDAGKGVPDSKCLECHTDIRKSIAEKSTFHGLAKGTCINCHSDHKGRSFNSTVVKQNSFDHGRTGFTLHGAHAHLGCAKCHTEKRSSKPIRQDGIRYFGKTETCVGCHKKDDVHAFPPKWAAKDCNACHNDKTWKEATFDHKRDTGYELVGSHAKISCAKCHTPHGKSAPKYSFPELKTEGCLSCHADFHKNNLDGKFKGGNCQQCHNQESWKIGNFNHDVTGFKLEGAHAKETCLGCHKQKGSNVKLKDANFTGLPSTCVGCHKDYHGFHNETSGKLGPLTQCLTCHTETSWLSSVNFNHNTQTNYPITGKHIGVKCFECHKPLSPPAHPNTPREYQFPQLATKTCETCHKSPHDAAHNPVFRTTKCSTCHTTDGWLVFNTGAGTFNHDTMTRFPLTGDHRNLKCAECHTKNGKQVFKFPGDKKGFCEDCHATPHKGQFETRYLKESCADCHDTVRFNNLQSFNHDRTQFHLVDAHKKIEHSCAKCHTPTKRMLPVKPPHPAGKFIFEHPQTGYCVDCHKNPHKDQFDEKFAGDDCRTCHNVKSFKDLNSFDHNKTKFHITGAHAKFKQNCVKCHIKTDKMLATNPPKPAGKFLFEHEDSGFCEACHKSVHSDQFDPTFAAKPCRECHGVEKFVHLLPFDHNKTPFKITGSHVKLKDECGKCHIKTDKMLATQPPKPADLFLFEHQASGFCEACHLNEHKDQFHPKFASESCVSCHTTAHFYAPINFDHKKSRYELKGKHQQVKCVECHKPTDQRFKEVPHHHKDHFIFADLLTKDCNLCHEDPHKGRFGKNCSQCHTEEGWGRTADFHKDMVLTGVHYLLECAECHTNKRELTGTGNDCKVCHMKDDNHMGTQPNCGECHNQQFWTQSRFQHSMTEFPLRGAHRLLDCAECHANGVYQGRATDCASCHQPDAIKVVFPNHKLSGFQQCDLCHNQFSFSGK